MKVIFVYMQPGQIINILYTMDLNRIEKFIKKQKVSFVTSIDNDNFPNVKAMLKPRKIVGLK